MLDSRQDDWFDELLSETRGAEHAGVFARTPIDVAALFSGERREAGGVRWWGRAARVLLPVAACVGLSVGVVRLWIQGAAGARSVGGAGSTHVDARQCPADFRLFNTCFTGPLSGEMAGECDCFDFDGDQDVDFADFGRFQRQLAMSNG